METETTVIRYPLHILMSMNDGRVLTSGKTHDLFNQYPTLPHRISYDNPHNSRFPKIKPAASQLKAHVFDSASIIQDIRKVLSSISRSNISICKERLNSIRIPNTEVKKVAQLFHSSMIECIHLLDEYLDVILSMSNEGLEHSILQEFVLILTRTFRHPPKFEDSAIENGEIRSDRWKYRNAVIIATIYSMNVHLDAFKDFSTELICDKFLDRLFADINSDNHASVVNLVEIWKLVSPRLKSENMEKYEKYIVDLKNLVQVTKRMTTR